MSYVPELRQSLVKAAERQAVQTAPSRTRGAKRRQPLAGIGFVLASATAILVAGLALVLVGHRTISPVHVGRSSVTPARVARTLLAQVRVPAGAVPVGGDMTSRAKLGAPYAGLPAPHAVDLHRFWRIRGDANTVLEGIQLGGLVRSPAPRTPGSHSAPPQPKALSTESIDPASQAGIAREIQAAVAPLPGGDSEVRVDVLAWYPVPGFTRDRMPSNISYITVFRDVGPHSRIPGSLVLLRRTSIEEIVRFIKSLRALGSTAPLCHAAPGDQLIFESDRLAVQARVEPACARVELSIDGEPADELTWIGAPVSTQTVNRFLALVVGRG